MRCRTYLVELLGRNNSAWRAPFRSRQHLAWRSFSTALDPQEHKPARTPYDKLQPVQQKVHSAGQLVRKKMKEPARDNNFTFDQWHLHRSRFRRFRHFAKFLNSATFHRLLFPDLTLVACISGGLVYANKFVLETPLAFPALPFQLTATALGLLLVFRTNQSNTRFTEARIAWGQVINSTRTICRIANLSAVKQHPKQVSRIMRLIRVLPRTMIFHLTYDGDLSNVVSKDWSSASPDAKDTELRKQVAFLLTTDESEALLAARHRPMWTFSELSDTINSIPDIAPVHLHRFEEELRALENALGACERVLLTPIPTSYTRHTSRFLATWVSMLPFALWPYCGEIGTVPTSLLVAFAMLAIEDIGVTLEDPAEIMPLWRYCDTIDNTVYFHGERARLPAYGGDSQTN